VVEVETIYARHQNLREEGAGAPSRTLAQETLDRMK